MNLIEWFVIVPLALGALATGLLPSIGTEWGLFRHDWIATKLLLGVLGAAVLLGHMTTVRGRGSMSSGSLRAASSGKLETQLVVHAAGGLVVWLVATTLSLCKPWGKTAYGRRKASGWRS